MGIADRIAAIAARALASVTNRLIEHRYQQLETVVLLDDVDQADPRTLQHVARLVRFDPSPDMRLTVVFAGRQECLGKLGQSLLSLADLRIDVEPWQRADTEQYVTTLLSQAGRCTPVFAEPAFDRLHELAHRHPSPRVPVGRPRFAGGRWSKSQPD